jgi:hypothetical protein
MSIRAVFRVQCDGPGREWLSPPEDHVPGRAYDGSTLIAAPTAERAGLWPGERAARTAALAAGWVPASRHLGPGTLMCPACAANPLGIVLPPSTSEQIAAIECGVMPEPVTVRMMNGEVLGL